jgi:O-antigen ligase
MILPLAIWGARHQPDPRTRLLCVLLSPVLLASLLLSETRNATFAFIVGMLAIYVMRRRRGLNLLVPVLTLVAMFGALLVASNFEWLRNTELYADYIDRQGTLGTATGRLYLWEESLRKIKDRPLVGYGFGTGGVVIGMADLPKMVSYESAQLASYSDALPMLNLNTVEGLNAHNAYLEICLELGVAGFAVCLFLLGCVTREMARVHREALPEAAATLAPYLGGSFIAGLVNQSCESALFSAGSIICISFWFIAAAILCLRSEPNSPRSER